MNHAQNYFTRERHPEELLHLAGDDSGYVQGKVFMVWPPRNKLHRINLEAVEGSVLYRFEVEVPHNEGIAFRPHERVSFALKGAQVVHRKESSSPHYFPIVLRFPHGVAFKYLSGINTGKVVNTWEEDTDEWYNPGTVNTVLDAIAVDASAACHQPTPTVTHPSAPDIPETDVTAGGAAVVRSVRPPQQPGVERSSRSFKARRKRRKFLSEKEKDSASTSHLRTGTQRPPPVNITTPCCEQSQMCMTNASEICIPSRQAGEHSKAEALIREDNGLGILHENGHTDTVTTPEEAGILALRPKAGICTQRGDAFTAILELRKGHSMVNVIGIVADVTPETKTSTNEWSRSITLVDPSTVDSQRSIKVNCFQKKHVEWLPQVQKDDIVILRKLKIAEYHGDLTATGYGDKLRWAVYDPLKNFIRPPNKGNAPEKELVDGGMGYEYSPYWEPCQDSAELEYCRQIWEWWKAERALGRHKTSEVECARPAPKQHLLISEASPDHPPEGFFNCTVEVLQKFNNQDVTTVYVTDYTANTLCTMWDGAGSIATRMNPGEYWYLHNIRARWNRDHHMEGTMQLKEKVTQLDETRLETQPRLKALLERKKEIGLNHSGVVSESSSLHIFPERLLQDVEENTNFFTCVVELLHIDLNPRDGHFVYVTDYTYNPDLPTTVSMADWAHNLEHRILKIMLDDSQARISSDLKAYSMYIIRNVRIKRLDVSGGMHGCLGGGDTLIFPLCDSSSHHIQALQGEKEKWKREIILNDSRLISKGLHEVTDELQSSTVWGNSVQEVVTWPAPAKFRMVARAIDFFPFSLEDASVLRCIKCESSPPPSFQRCPRCDDMMESHCKWFYCLYVLLQDKKGDEIIVSLSGKECTLLQDIGPTDFRHDRVTFCNFLAKIDPILGNLRDVHLAWSRNENKVIESPLMMFTLESWDVNNEKAYGLVDCTAI